MESIKRIPLTPEEVLITTPSVDARFYKNVYQSQNKNWFSKGQGGAVSYAIAAERFVNMLTRDQLITAGNGLGPKSVLDKVLQHKFKIIICMLIDIQLNDVPFINEQSVSRDYKNGAISYSEAAQRFKDVHDMVYEAVRSQWRAWNLDQAFDLLPVQLSPSAFVLLEDLNSDNVDNLSTIETKNVTGALNILDEEVTKIKDTIKDLIIFPVSKIIRDGLEIELLFTTNFYVSFKWKVGSEDYASGNILFQVKDTNQYENLEILSSTYHSETKVLNIISYKTESVTPLTKYTDNVNEFQIVNTNEEIVFNINNLDSIYSTSNFNAMPAENEYGILATEKGYYKLSINQLINLKPNHKIEEFTINVRKQIRNVPDLINDPIIDTTLISDIENTTPNPIDLVFNKVINLDKKLDGQDQIYLTYKSNIIKPEQLEPIEDFIHKINVEFMFVEHSIQQIEERLVVVENKTSIQRVETRPDRKYLIIDGNLELEEGSSLELEGRITGLPTDIYSAYVILSYPLMESLSGTKDNLSGSLTELVTAVKALQTGGTGDVSKEYVDQQDALKVDKTVYDIDKEENDLRVHNVEVINNSQDNSITFLQNTKADKTLVDDNYATTQTRIAFEESNRTIGDNLLQGTIDQLIADQIVIDSNQDDRMTLIETKNTSQDISIQNITNFIASGLDVIAGVTQTGISNIAAKIPLEAIKDSKSLISNGNISIPTGAVVGQIINVNATFYLSSNGSGQIYAFNTTKGINVGPGFGSFGAELIVSLKTTWAITPSILEAGDIIEIRAIKGGGANYNILASSRITFDSAEIAGSGSGASTTDDIKNTHTGTYISALDTQTLTNKKIDDTLLLKANQTTTYTKAEVDSSQSTQDILINGHTTQITELQTSKADKVYVDAQNATQDTLITNLRADLTNEETARINGDSGLSSRIGALEASAGTGGDIRFQQQFLIPSTYVRKRIGEGFNSIMLTNHPDILNGDDLIFTNSNKIFRKSPGSITWVDSGIVVPTGTQRVWNKEATLYALAVTFAASNKFAAIHRSTDQGATWTLWKQTTANTSTSTGTTPLLAICRNATHYFVQAFTGGSSSLLYNIWRIQDIETGAVVQMQYQFASTSGIDFFVATNEMIYWKEGSAIKRLKADNTTPVVTMTLPTPNFTIGTGGDVDDEGTLWIGNHNATNTKLFYANAATSYAFVGIDLAYPLTTGCVFFFKDDTYKYIVAASNVAGSGDYGMLKKTIDGGTWETLGKSTLSGFSGTSSGFEIRGVVGYNPETKRVRTDSPGTKTTNYSFGA